MGRIELWGPGLLVSFFYLYNFIPKTELQGELSHTWSLAVEEQFYLFWPLVLLTLRRRGTVIVALSIVLLSAIAYLWFPVVVVPGSSSGLKLANVFYVRRLFIPAVAGIMIGSMAALWLHERGSLVADRCARWWWMPLGLALYLLPLCWPVILDPLALMPMAVAVSMVLIWLMHHQVSTLAQVLEWRPLAYLGRISYGLYIYHVIFMGTEPGYGLVKVFPYNVLAALAFSVVSYELLERRVLSLKDRFR
jgi:peptidoglycan/LPS O-acetylase OafA/YrhL